MVVGCSYLWWVTVGGWVVMSVGVGELTAATNEMTGKVTAGQSEAWKLSTRRPLHVRFAVGG